jgi:hypothetical protein
MPSVSIQYQHTDTPALSTTDAATISTLRNELGPAQSHFVPAEDLSSLLSKTNRHLWAKAIEGSVEGCSMVTVRFE